jgi:hypothetical protein
MKHYLVMAAALALVLPGVSLAMGNPYALPPTPPPAAATAATETAALPNTCGPVVDEPPKPADDAAKTADPSAASSTAAPATPTVGLPASTPSPSTPASTPAASPDTAAAQPAIQPAAPVLPKLKEKVGPRVCADGKLETEVEARLFGYKMGFTVPIEITIKVKDGAVINLDPLKRHQMAFEDSANKKFELVSDPIVEESKVDGGTEYDILLEVRNFMPAPYMTFTMQVPYAVTFAKDKTPIWQLMTTPPFTFNQYVDGLETMPRPMTMGNTGMVQPRKPWAVPASAIVVALLFLIWPGIELVRFVNRVRPRKGWSRDALAWHAIYRTVKSGKEIGFSGNHYRKISDVLRDYLKTTYPSLPGMTMSEIEGLPDDVQGSRVKSAFRKLDRVLFDGERLAEKEHAQLIDEVDELIKRPFSI